MGSKTWVFTINNYTPEDVGLMEVWARESNKFVATKEVGTEGTPHIQGAVTWKAAMRAPALKKLHGRAHWEVAKAERCCFVYCVKEGSELIIQYERNSKGERTDIAAAYRAVEDGRSEREFMLAEHPGFQALQVFRAAKLRLSEPRPIGPIEVIWRYGPTGTGKTRWAYETYPDLYRVNSFKWWDGYDGQETILIDDMRGDFCKFHEILGLLDIYPFQKETKGGWVQVQFKRVVITAPYSPQEMWSSRTTEDIAQLCRRITKVDFVGPPVTVTVTEVGKGNTSLSLPDPYGSDGLGPYW